MTTVEESSKLPDAIGGATSGGQTGLAGQVASGSLWSLGGHAVALVASLVTTPIVIRLLGTEAYGVLALINVLIGYLAFADLGMGVASTRFGSDAHARGEDEREATIVWTALLISTVPALVGALGLALLARPLVEQVLRLPPELHEVSIVAVRIAAAGFVARSVAGVVNTPQLTRLRMDWVTIISAGTVVGQALLIPFVLYGGGGLTAAVAVIAGTSAAAALLNATASAWLLPRLLRPRVERALIKPLARFGGSVVVSSLAMLVLLHGEKLLLTRLGSVRALAHYSVAYSLAWMLTIAPTAISQALLPAFSRLQSAADRPALERLYSFALRGTLLWLAPVSMIVCVAAKPFFTLWAGEEYGRESTIPFYILIFGIAFSVASFVPAMLLTALGHANLIARSYLAQIVPFLLVAALFAHWWGAVGAAVAMSLRMLASSLAFFWMVRRTVGEGFGLALLAGNKWQYLAAAAVLMLPVPLIVYVPAMRFFGIGLVAASLVVYAILVWTKTLTSEEKNWIGKRLRYAGIKR